MIANYHTHTYRCGHAENISERAYIEKAIELGIRDLGFSDHSPMPMPKGCDICTKNTLLSIRMSMDETDDYVNTLLKLKEEYKNDINIHIGFEVEYFACVFDELIEYLSQYPTEYIILGQHFSDFDTKHKYYGDKTSRADVLEEYVSQVIKGIRTGKFTYLAHPDLINYGQAPLDAYEREAKRLINCANEHKIPLEINFYGLQQMRNYPTLQFWQIANDIGCDVVFGSDAHFAKNVCDPTALRFAENLVKSFPNLNLLENISLKPIK